MNTPLTSSTPASVSETAPANGEPAFPPLKKHLHAQEVAYIHRAIDFTGGDKKKAALLLDISLATLYRKLDDE